MMTFRPRFFGLTFRPRFYNSSSYPRNLIETKDGGLYRTSFCKKFGAVLVVIIISAGDAIFAKFHKK